MKFASMKLVLGAFAIFGMALCGAAAAQGPTADATLALSTLVGALLVARAVDDPELSERILRDARAALIAQREAPIVNSGPNLGAGV